MVRTQQTTKLILGFLFLLVLLLVACSSSGDSQEVAEEKWQNSAHADESARAFSRWNDADPPEIPENCAKCHSTHGYRDFLGLDGATAGQVDKPAPVGTTVECEACHNEVASQHHTVMMPSGSQITDLGGEANCMECHQGRTSTVTVEEAIAGKELDQVDEELSFINVHNKAAAATQYGTLAKGGYELAGQEYVGFYEHDSEFDTCIACHDAHALEVVVENCGACHAGVKTRQDLANIRVTNIDFDGDGDVMEGMSGEIETLREGLLKRIQLYAAITEGTEKIFYEDRNPYFFDEAGEGYSTWTPRLLRVAYNYHYTTKEPGGYAHNPFYHIQLLYDSMNDVGPATVSQTRPESTP